MSSSDSWSVIVSSLESLDNHEVFLESIITLCIGVLQSSGLWKLVYIRGLFNGFLPLLTSLVLFPIDSTKFIYLWYAWFQSISKHSLQSLLNQRQLSLIPSLYSLDRTALLFLFSNCVLLFPWEKKHHSQGAKSIIANRVYSVKIGCWKVPQIYFSGCLWHLTLKVCNVMTVNNSSEVHLLFSKVGT